MERTYWMVRPATVNKSPHVRLSVDWPISQSSFRVKNMKIILPLLSVMIRRPTSYDDYAFSRHTKLAGLL